MPSIKQEEQEEKEEISDHKIQASLPVALPREHKIFLCTFLLSFSWKSFRRFLSSGLTLNLYAIVLFISWLKHNIENQRFVPKYVDT